jgi:NAD(P)-dependent dehydrogenase (short-subunit alcohol dehydrogenase family)
MADRSRRGIGEGAGRLADRVIFVTGASSGIGLAAVRRFAAEGAKVVAAARRFDRLETLVDEVNRAGAEAIAVECDVEDADSVRDAIDVAVKSFGRIDGAFNNAGIGGAHVPMHEIDIEQFDRVLSTNLRGVFLCMKYELAQMKENESGGSIVITSSTSGLYGNSLDSDYCASKWALTGLVKSAALGYARYGIRVNAVAPGPTETELTYSLGHLATKEAIAREVAGFALGRLADPDEIACAAAFLLSDEASCTTGDVIACDQGGRTTAR